MPLGIRIGIDVIGGLFGGIGAGGAPITFYAPMIDSFNGIRGDGSLTPTYSHGNNNNVTHEDHRGIVSNVGIAEPRFLGCRRMENLTAYASSSTVSPSAFAVNPKMGKSVICSFDVLIGGEVSITMGTDSLPVSFPAVAGKRYVTEPVVCNDTDFVMVVVVTGGSATNWMWEVVDPADPVPSEYVDNGVSYGALATGIKYSRYANGTVLNGREVVSTGTGAVISEGGYHAEPEVTELLLQNCQLYFSSAVWPYLGMSLPTVAYGSDLADDTGTRLIATADGGFITQSVISPQGQYTFALDIKAVSVDVGVALTFIGTNPAIALNIPASELSTTEFRRFYLKSGIDITDPICAIVLGNADDEIIVSYTSCMQTDSKVLSRIRTTAATVTRPQTELTFSQADNIDTHNFDVSSDVVNKGGELNGTWLTANSAGASSLVMGGSNAPDTITVAVGVIQPGFLMSVSGAPSWSGASKIRLINDPALGLSGFALSVDGQTATTGQARSWTAGTNLCVGWDDKASYPTFNGGIKRLKIR